ncbi:DHA3 family macrolide efflux protein-like MFS transporter [Ereboglobus sp. PH5-5]|uniref:MFS transporter n=1 Tax=Ereboglobus sp. PH5-5 TaxID=2940529 RepID=UPI0024063F4F|nr:MFS transporter [Ereboglobus sp. PH5-5]MDF9832850.1 DHA3 family macrolide efflux protein-like MFS transporter [Ereboglobus sp. PH5-5]
MEKWKKVFAIIWAGQFLSILSSTIVNFAVILWLSIETGSAQTLALAAIAAMLPQALIGPVSGVFIDRWNRKHTMIAADGFIALCTLLLAVLFALGIARTWHIFLLLALRSVGSAFHMPAMQASVPLLAPESQLTRIAGINQMIYSVGNIAGPALGALCITIWDMQYVLLLDVAGALFACGTLLFVAIPKPAGTGARSQPIAREMKEGFLAVWANRPLSLVFLFSILVMFFIMPVSVLFPLMTLEHFKGNAFQVSLVEVLWGVGSLVGGAVMGMRVYNINRVALVNWMYLLLGATFALSGMLSQNGFAWFAVYTAVGGVAGAVYMATFTAIIQTNVASASLGRVFSMFHTVSIIPSLIGLAGIGFFAERLGLALSFVVCGVIICLIGLAAFIARPTLQIDKKQPAPANG